MVPLVLAMELASFVPGLIKAFGGKKAGETAEKVLNIAKGVTGISDDRQAIDAIKADPSKALEFNMRVLELKAAGELAEWKDEEDRRKDIRESGWLSRLVRPVIALTFHFFIWAVMFFCDAATVKAKLGIELFSYGTIKVTIGAAYVLIVLFYFMTKGMKDFFISKNPTSGIS